MNVRKDEEILIGERDFDSIYSYTAGTTRSKFLTELRDNQKIVGTRCPDCNRVLVPARSICVKCFANLKDFVEVGPSGTVSTYSVIHTSQDFYPLDPPFALGVIQLDGADTGFVHFIGEADPEAIETGIKVEAVFNEERTGSILDIKYFRPVNK
ncbi:Zn-ribbon domain-containing OB-fold protein [Thermodesulfobacteriota bacterium]